MEHKTNQKKYHRRNLKKRLASGDMQKIATTADVALNTVWRWFEGISDNADVERAYHMLIEKKEQDLKKRLNNI